MRAHFFILTLSEPTTSTVSPSVMLMTFAENLFGGLSGWADADVGETGVARQAMLGLGAATCKAHAPTIEPATKLAGPEHDHRTVGLGRAARAETHVDCATNEEREGDDKARRTN